MAVVVWSLCRRCWQRMKNATTLPAIPSRTIGVVNHTSTTWRNILTPGSHRVPDRQTDRRWRNSWTPGSLKNAVQFAVQLRPISSFNEFQSPLSARKSVELFDIVTVSTGALCDDRRRTLIPRLHDQAGSTSWLYVSWTSQLDVCSIV